MYYEYQNEDGIKYFGQIEINGREKAEAKLGTQVKIYIDGKGFNVLADGFDKDTPTRGVILSIFFSLLFGGLLAVIIKSSLAIKRRRLPCK